MVYYKIPLSNGQQFDYPAAVLTRSYYSDGYQWCEFESVEPEEDWIETDKETFDAGFSIENHVVETPVEIITATSATWSGSNIYVTIPNYVMNGTTVKFESPCMSSEATGIVINNGDTFQLYDVANQYIGGYSGFFDVGSIVSILVDTDNHKAYLQSQATVNIGNELASDYGITIPTVNKALEKALEKIDEAATTGGKKYCKVVIGTSTNGWTATDCDYLCDGTADEVEFNNAITSLGTNGGKIIVLEGSYNFTNPIQLKSNIDIEGIGECKLFSKSETSIAIIESTDINILNVKISGLTFSEYDYCISCGSDSSRITNLTIRNCRFLYHMNVNINAICISIVTGLSGCENIIIEDNYFDTRITSIYITGICDDIIINNNVINTINVSVIELEYLTAENIKIINNIINFNSTGSNSDPYIELNDDNISNVLISNNILSTARLTLTGLKNCIITNNIISSWENVITITSGQDFVINGNRLMAKSNTNNKFLSVSKTSSNILFISNNCDGILDDQYKNVVTNVNIPPTTN